MGSIKTSELRLGNIVLKDGKELVKVMAIGQNTLDTAFLEREVTPITVFDKVSIDRITGVPLIEEYFLKFGFKKRSDVFYKARFEVYKPVDWTNYMFTENRLILREIKYAHTLQNTFFALTGEELI